ncbi:MAG: hypothetical protein NZM28_03635 [Fimbriimonadales bacterium]|nr:hypothetical protein [Fimbriimonadales bacterium]
MKRPLSMIIIGIVGALWGAYASLIGFVGAYCLLAMPDWFVNTAREMMSSRYLEALQHEGFRRTGAILTLVQAALALLLVVGSVQLLRFKPIGWRLMMVYVVLAIVWAVADRVLDSTVRERYRQELRLLRRDRPDIRLLPGILFTAVAGYFLTRPKIAELYGQEWFTRED